MKKVNSSSYRQMADGSRRTTRTGETSRGVAVREVTTVKWDADKKQRETTVVETFGDHTKSKSKPKAKTKRSSSKKKTTNKSKKSKK